MPPLVSVQTAVWAKFSGTARSGDGAIARDWPSVTRAVGCMTPFTTLTRVATMTVSAW